MIDKIKAWLFKKDEPESETRNTGTKTSPKGSYDNPIETSELPTKHGFYKLTEPQTVFKATREGIARLRLPGEQTVFLTYSKCRAEKAFVTGLYGLTSEVHTSLNDTTFKYYLGEAVVPDGFTKRKRVCARGIHFFRTVNKAVEWYINQTSDVTNKQHKRALREYYYTDDMKLDDVREVMSEHAEVQFTPESPLS